jgi:hypothetical protein
MLKAQAMQTYPDFLDATGLLNDGRALRVQLDREVPSRVVLEMPMTHPAQRP